jgi:UDP-N-acetylmuramoyl-tripeptide--D-alanyl-D-alanine ligase
LFNEGGGERLKLTLGQIADWIHAEGTFDTSAEALGYSIDSRTTGAGELFFAVKGERVDGHDYVEAALADGAVAAVVSMRWLRPVGVEEARLLRVPDGDECVLRAMQRLANSVRRSWGGRVIGVTGSAGKTTTKECVAEVLATKFKVLKGEGNLNNHFGLPLQLLRLEPEHEVAVLEMGMNHAGEIRALAKIAEPDWAVVSNVAAVHLEFFTDGIEGIARAKYELIEALPADGIAVLNGDDERVRTFGHGMGARAVLYGMSEGCAVRAEAIDDHGLRGIDFDLVVESRLIQGQIIRWPVALRLPGRHNVMNALAAIAVGLMSAVEVQNACGALERMRPTEKRGNVLVWRGAEIVNDTYNSNPRALDSMVEALRNTPARRRIVVAGEMLELGPAGASLHGSCGAAMSGLDVVVGVWGLARELVDAARAAGVGAAEFVESPELAGEWLRANLREGDVVLLKASRGVRLERALEVLGAP